MAYTYDAYDPNKKPPATTLKPPTTPAIDPREGNLTAGTLQKKLKATAPAPTTAQPSTTTLKPPDVAGNVRYFGSPEAYAQAIMQKGPGGLTDSAAAAAFKAANPGLFSSKTPAPTGEKIPPSQSFGGELPPTGQPGQQPQQNPLSSENIQEIFRGMLSEYMPILDQMAARDNAAMERGMAALTGAIDLAQAQITSMFQEQLGGMDPATQMALDRIKKDAKEYRDRMMEDMSRRGLLQSGIAIQSDIKLGEGQLDAEQQLLATRISDIQNRMTSALMNFAQMRIDAIKQYGLAGVDMSAQAGNRQMAAMQSAMGSAFQLAGAQEGQRQFNVGQAESTRQFDTSQAEGTRQFDLTYEQREKHFAEQMALNKEQLTADAKRLASQQGLDWARLSETQKQNMIDNAYREKHLAWQKEQADKGDSSDYATRTALTALKEYKTREEAMTALTQGDRWQRMVQQGVDMQKLLAEINKLPEKKTPDFGFMP